MAIGMIYAIATVKFLPLVYRASSTAIGQMSSRDHTHETGELTSRNSKRVRGSHTTYHREAQLLTDCTIYENNGIRPLTATYSWCRARVFRFIKTDGTSPRLLIRGVAPQGLYS